MALWCGRERGIVAVFLWCGPCDRVRFPLRGAGATKGAGGGAWLSGRQGGIFVALYKLVYFKRSFSPAMKCFFVLSMHFTVVQFQIGACLL